MRTKPIVILSGIMLSITILWFLSIAHSKYNEVQRQWQEYIKTESAVTHKMHKLDALLGYGGMIHTFKNYVIRADQNYRHQLDKEILLINETIGFLEENSQDKMTKVILTEVTQTVKLYQQKIETIAKLHQQGVSVYEIDKRVKVNDKKALFALDRLHVRIIERENQMRKETEQSIIEANKFLLYGIALLIPIILSTLIIYCMIAKINSVTKSIQKSSHWVDSLLDASPDATVIVNKKGIITRVNKSAQTMFGYEQNEMHGMQVENLMPAKFHRAHHHHRENYHNAPSAKHMGGDKRELKALTKDGLELNVEINLNSPSIDGEVFSIATLRDIGERLAANKKIVHQAHYDQLTGLPNRLLAMDRLKQKLLESKRNKHNVTVLFIDLDDFKKVNDSLGHEMGDKVLIELSKRLSQEIRSSDTVARLGGDEFIVILDDLSSNFHVQQVVEKILNTCSQPFTLDNRTLVLTVSIGIVNSPQDGQSTSELLRNADTAMYRSKDLGRNTYTFYTQEMNDKVKRQLELEEHIRQALDNHEFYVVFQPKLSLVTEQVIGMEALLRWKSGTLGNVSPDEFIPIAEHTGHINPIGKFVLNEALSFIKSLNESGHDNLCVAVNLSPIQFRDPSLLNFIESTIKQNGVNAADLVLEITEGVLLSSNTLVNNTLLDIKSLGIKTAMDDFGTGYSSLSYLREYDFDILKIDRSFLEEIEDKPGDRALVTATVLMAHTLGLKVVAEGAETQAQVNILKAISCDYVQGYFYSKPLKAHALISYLEQTKQR